MDFVLPNKNLNKLVIRFYFYKKLLIVIKVKYDITTPNLFNLLFQRDSPSKCGHIDWELEALPAQVGLGRSWIPPSVGRCKVMNWEVFKNSTFQTWYVICGGVLIQNHERHVMAAMCGSVMSLYQEVLIHVLMLVVVSRHSICLRWIWVSLMLFLKAHRFTFLKL